MRKWLVCLMATSLVLLLCACSSTNSSNKASLEFMYWGSVFEKKAINGMLQSFESSHPKIDIIAKHVPDEYDTKMNTLMASGKLPDVAYLTESTAMEWAAKGKLLNIEKYFDEYPRLKHRLPQTYYYYAKGKTIGTNTAAEVMNLYYNKDLLNTEGVDLPPSKAQQAWNWEQFVKTAQKLTIDENGNNALSPNFDPKHVKQYGVSFPTSYLGYYPFLISNGGQILNDEGTKFVMNSQKSIEVFQRLHDLMYKYHVSPTPTQRENMPGSSVLLQTKRVAMVIDGQWSILDFSESKLNFGIGVLPKMGQPHTVILGAPTVIFANTKHPKKAIELYLYHNNPEKVNLFKKGLWMPLEKKYYTDEKYIKMWTDNKAHPPEYKDAVIDYTLNYAVPSPTYTIKNWNQISDAMNAKLDLIWLNKKPVKEVLDEIKDKVTPMLKRQISSTLCSKTYI